MPVRAIRGAIQLDNDSREHLLDSTRELVQRVTEVNGITHDQWVCIIFTATPDITTEFPAVAARELGMGDIPLMCAVEMDIAHAMPRVIRLMAIVETELDRDQIKHVYLRGATKLRLDIAQ